VGAEVANGGWIVSFLLKDREGGPDIGYVSTGFFLGGWHFWQSRVADLRTGLTISRILFVPLNRFLGNRTAVLCYLAAALAFEFVIWFVRDLVTNAVAISLVGLFFGPLYPIGVAVLTQLLPRSYHTAAIGFVAGMSAVGSAFVPYIVGALAQHYSVSVLQPVEVAIIGAMIVVRCVLCSRGCIDALQVWLFIPKEDKTRRE
jgi:fucose permease